MLSKKNISPIESLDAVRFEAIRLFWEKKERMDACKQTRRKNLSLSFGFHIHGVFDRIKRNIDYVALLRNNPEILKMETVPSRKLSKTKSHPFSCTPKEIIDLVVLGIVKKTLEDFFFSEGTGGQVNAL